MKDDGRYVRDSCGQEIVLPIDLSVGSTKEYVEDCPVCCRPPAAPQKCESNSKKTATNYPVILTFRIFRGYCVG